MTSKDTEALANEIKRAMTKICSENGVFIKNGIKNNDVVFPKITIKYNNNWRKMHHLPLVRRKGKKK